jgi:hypothetical protein
MEHLCYSNAVRYYVEVFFECEIFIEISNSQQKGITKACVYLR